MSVLFSGWGRGLTPLPLANSRKSGYQLSVIFTTPVLRLHDEQVQV